MEDQQRAIDMINSLSRENSELSAKLESPLCRVCQKLILLPEHGFQTVIGNVHESCREGFQEMMDRFDRTKGENL